MITPHMLDKKVAAVVPTIRGFTVPRQTVPVNWYVVHDIEGIPDTPDAVNIRKFNREMYGNKCDSIRSVGFYQALKDGHDIILTVDDDCRLEPRWAEQHLEALLHKTHPWHFPLSIRTRGIPYDVDHMAVGISHGLWDGIPDLDAKTQLGKFAVPNPWMNDNVWERINAPFPQSAMNLGFTREVAAAMYMPAQGEGFAFDRFADVWCGVLAQKVLDLHGIAFMSGGACVYHDRASNPEVNFKKEAPGLECHELFWKYIWSWTYKPDAGDSIAKTYRELGEHVRNFPIIYPQGGSTWTQYFALLSHNMQSWANMTEQL